MDPLPTLPYTRLRPVIWIEAWLSAPLPVWAEVVLIVSVAFVATHATGVPLRLMLMLHRGAFEAAGRVPRFRTQGRACDAEDTASGKRSWHLKFLRA